MVHERQEHILIGCADARDVGQVHVDAVRETRSAFLADGILAQFHAIRVPGAFVSDDVVCDVRRIVHEAQRTDSSPELPLSVFIHVQSHGVVENPPEEGVHAYDLRISDDPALNCGMLSATHVAVALEGALLSHQPEIELRNGTKIRIESEGDIRRLLHEVYGHDGYLAGDWIRSIDDLRTHARSQRSRLERALESDPELRRVDIKVTAGLQDYLHHRHWRTDRDEISAPFWDEVHRRVHEHADAEPENVERQAERQAPLAGLVGMAKLEDSPRSLAARWYAEQRAHVGHSHAGSVFTLSSSSFDAPHVPFGPYAIAGMYHLLQNLGARDVMVLGRNQAQTNRMIAKLRHDPLMSFVLDMGGAHLIPLATDGLLDGYWLRDWLVTG